MSLKTKNMERIMKALSIRQPWAWLIVNGVKDVENRSWPLPGKFIGKRVLIHAGKHFDPEEIVDIFDSARAEGMLRKGGHVTPRDIQSQCGGIVGSCIFSGCVRDSSSPWAMPGEYHWLIESPAVQGFKPMRGMLGFFNVE